MLWFVSHMVCIIIIELFSFSIKAAIQTMQANGHRCFWETLFLENKVWIQFTSYIVYGLLFFTFPWLVPQYYFFSKFTLILKLHDPSKILFSPMYALPISFYLIVFITSVITLIYLNYFSIKNIVLYFLLCQLIAPSKRGYNIFLSFCP